MIKLTHDRTRRLSARSDKGFTLIELLVTVAVALILLTVAVPAWKWLVSGSRLGSTADLLQTGYRMARTEAVNSSSTSTLQPAIGQDWSSGWVVKVKTQAGSDVVVWRSGTLPAGITVTPDTQNVVRVSGSGTLKLSTGGAQGPCKFTVTSDNASMCLNLLVSGQSYLADGGC